MMTLQVTKWKYGDELVEAVQWTGKREDLNDIWNVAKMRDLIAAMSRPEDQLCLQRFDSPPAFTGFDRVGEVCRPGDWLVKTPAGAVLICEQARFDQVFMPPGHRMMEDFQMDEQLKALHGEPCHRPAAPPA